MAMTPKSVERFRKTSNTSRRCRQAGCTRFTRRDKAFCPDHIENLPYVQGLLKRISDREIEMDAARRCGAGIVDVNSSVSLEILSAIRVLGPSTNGGIALWIGHNAKTQAHYIAALYRADLIAFERVRRNNRYKILIDVA